jgi:hypothetical protein
MDAVWMNFSIVPHAGEEFWIDALHRPHSGVTYDIGRQGNCHASDCQHSSSDQYPLKVLHSFSFMTSRLADRLL